MGAFELRLPAVLVRAGQAHSAVRPDAPKAVRPKSGVRMAIRYTLKNWDALCRYSAERYLEPDNNYAERCLRLVALGRKNFLFVGSERAGHAAAIHYGRVERCKVNKVNPLSCLTYPLSHGRNQSVTLLTADEFTASNIAYVGSIAMPEQARPLQLAQRAVELLLKYAYPVDEKEAQLRSSKARNGYHRVPVSNTGSTPSCTLPRHRTVRDCSIN